MVILTIFSLFLTHIFCAPLKISLIEGNGGLCFNLIEYQDISWSVQIDFSVYDVTRRETFTNLSDIWAKEIDLYSTNQDCIKMLVGNKVDKVIIICFSSTLSSALYASLKFNPILIMMFFCIGFFFYVLFSCFYYTSKYSCLVLAGKWESCDKKRGHWICQGIRVFISRMQC